MFLDAPLLVDRAAECRDSVDLAAAHAVVVVDGAVLVRDGQVVRLAPGSHPQAALVAFLGQAQGQDLALVVPEDGAQGVADVLAAGAELVALRPLLATLDARHDGALDRELATTAVALARWHGNHPRCAHCGEPTVPTSGGWVRRCEAEERDHYPRTDPAIIVAVTDADDRLLVAHASTFSAGRYSHLAGYVEPGESFEQAVHREVAEEVGLAVADIEYVGSQPWPFPASVMVGFRATAVSLALSPDGVEITDALWVTRAELDAATEAGRMVLPPAGSIARSLLEQWRQGAAADVGAA
ncbi:NAD(+) diphosphatase [Demequina litorisediminis]|uniref:NAD(+) diphosphatase n=1 Tax=Demequina litorisediminis TaxID=1849022 RepID=UPI0024E17492|nr:NAD(+) diphosphatase [Demequina litorisediminis]